jgi:OTU-like cysteine protease/SEC-C motif
MAKTTKKHVKGSKPKKHDIQTVPDKLSKASSRKKNRKGTAGDSVHDDDQFRRKLQAGEFVCRSKSVHNQLELILIPIMCILSLKDGLTIADMAADGNCLFRSLSDQLYADYGNMHEEIRSDICDFMEQNKEDFQLFLVLDDDSCNEGDDGKDFESYIKTMRGVAEWGGNLELVAAARLYERNVTVFSAALSAYTIEPDKEPTGPDLLLSFHDNDHYNSVRDVASPHPPVKYCKPKSTRLDRSQPEASLPERTTTAASSVSEACSTTKGNSIAKIPANKKGVCPCGSGQRYRKCCLAKEKHAARLDKMRLSESQDHDLHRTAEREETKMIGSFLVLKI